MLNLIPYILCTCVMLAAIRIERWASVIRIRQWAESAGIAVPADPKPRGPKRDDSKRAVRV